ncbi:MAG TPA: helix-turn-helix domain-containing protein [Candidatus Binatia bacterium]|nr:helix-turn-helix domain-containing protein [Candidatus Binatia bacterium]
MVLTKGRSIEKVDLSELELPIINNSERSPWELPLPIWMKQQEKSYLMAKLNECGGRIELTAVKSGIDVRSLHRKMRFHGLDKKSYQSNCRKAENADGL